MYIRKFLYIVLFCSSFAAHAGEGVNNAVKQAKDMAVQGVYSYGDSAIETWARDNLSSLRLIEMETRSRADSKPTFRVITLFELGGDDYNKFLNQVSYSTFDDDETLNIGLVYRMMNQDMTRMYGLNVFYDHEFNNGHARTGLGFEMKSTVYDININLYEAMTERHHIDTVPEVAAGGYDAEIGTYLPYLPWAKFYYKKYQWSNPTKRIRHGEMFSLYMEPTSRLTVEGGMQDDSFSNSYNAFIKLNYVLCCNERNNQPGIFTVSRNAFSFGKLNQERMYEKVRRENNMVTVKGGGEITVTASGF